LPPPSPNAIHTLSLHDALPISDPPAVAQAGRRRRLPPPHPPALPTRLPLAGDPRRLVLSGALQTPLHRRLALRAAPGPPLRFRPDRKSTRLNSSHLGISYAVFC